MEKGLAGMVAIAAAAQPQRIQQDNDPLEGSILSDYCQNILQR